MMLRNSTVILVVFAAATSWGQASAGVPAHRRQPVIATSNADGAAAAARAKVAANQQMEEMGATLAKMHSLLKQMRAKTASSAKDAIAKANLDMWALMLEQLDKQYEQLSLAARARQDLEARRAALYKQADQKASEAAKSAREAQKAAVAEAPQAAQSGSQPAAAQAPQAAQAPASSSPN
jgi:hypothetical protein